jgi:hypothetical protein
MIVESAYPGTAHDIDLQTDLANPLHIDVHKYGTVR